MDFSPLSLPECTNCQGQSCSNVRLIPIEEDLFDMYEETADSYSVEEFMNLEDEEEEEIEDVCLTSNVKSRIRLKY